MEHPQGQATEIHLSEGLALGNWIKKRENSGLFRFNNQLMKE